MFAGGLELKFFANEGFEPLEDLSGRKRDRANARNLIRLLMLQQIIGWRQAVNIKTIRFAFYESSNHEREYMIEALQEGLNNIGGQLKHKTLNEYQHHQADILISNILSYVPFAYPPKDCKIDVPQFINGEWKMIPYTIQPIELTAQRSNVPLIFNHCDRIWAFGLAPQIKNPNILPWLLYQGTTYPSGSGFITQVMSDMKPFQTVGHDLFISGLSEIKNWFEQYSNTKMKVTGVSLGGSLSLLTACHLGDKCEQVIALNPAGLVENSKLAKIDRWDQLTEKPNAVWVIKQGADPVSLLGSWKEDWTILNGVVKKDSPNFFTHHFVNFAGSKHTQFIEETDEKKQDKYHRRIRLFNNVFWYTGGRAVIYGVFLLPWRYFVVPMYRLAKACFIATYVLARALISTAMSVLTDIVMVLMKGITMLVNGMVQLTNSAVNCCHSNQEISNGDIENQVGMDDKEPCL